MIYDNVGYLLVLLCTFSFYAFFSCFPCNDTPPCDGNKIAASGLSETWWMRTEIVLWGPQRRWSQTAFLSSSINDNGPFYTNVPNTARRVTRITNVWERIVTIVNACIIVFDGTMFFFLFTGRWNCSLCVGLEKNK